jgi:hypothetical protein
MATTVWSFQYHVFPLHINSTGGISERKATNPWKTFAVIYEYRGGMHSQASYWF